MAFFIFLCLISSNLVFRKSKVAYFLLVFYMWFLSAYCTSNPDTNIYINRYYFYATQSSITEIGFDAYVRLLNFLGFDFQIFLCISFLFVFAVLGWFIYKNSDNRNTTLVIYAVTTFFLDYIQIRSSIAFAFVLIGLDFLLNAEKKPILKYAVFVTIASLFHFSFVIMYILILAKVLSVNKIKSTVFLAIVGGLTLLNPIFVKRIMLIFASEDKVDGMLGHEAKMLDVSENIVLIYYIVVILSSVFVLLLFNYIEKRQELQLSDKCEHVLTQGKFQIIYKISMLALIVIPLLNYFTEAYRLHRYLILLSFIGLNRIYYVKIPFSKSIRTIFLVIIVAIIGYLQLMLAGFMNVILPVFENNKFL